MGGPPMEDPNAGMMGGMGAPPPPPPPEMVAAQQEGQDSENVNVEEDAAMIAETLVGRTGNIETAVAVLDIAKAMLMGGGDPMAQEQPIMANMGGPLYREDGGTMSDTDLLRQMIMSGLQDRTMSNNDMSGRAMSDRDMSGRTMSDSDVSGRPLSLNDLKRYAAS